MTGIERLREFVAGIRPTALAWVITSKQYDREHPETNDVSLRDLLTGIADQIAREHAEDCFRMGERAADVSMSAYDLLPADEREAIAWVREHGGLEQVRVDFAEGAAFGDVVDDIAERLGVSVSGLDSQDARDRIIPLLDRRLMPEGMEWPRFEDEEPVKFGDMALIDGEADMVEAVQLWIHGKPVIYGDNGSQRLEKGERVKRPAPEVLDTDGAEIRVGDTVWATRDLDKYTVTGIEDEKFLRVVCKGEDAEEYRVHPDDLTHRAPVLAADGRPLREGETVWHVKTGREYVVVEPSYGKTVVVRLAKYDDAEGECHAPDQLTHERPDSWERLEEDVANASCPDVYCANHHIDASDASYEWAMARDIVRRAKALAGDA